MPIPGERSATPSNTSPTVAQGHIAAGQLETSSKLSAKRKLPDLTLHGPFLLHHNWRSWELVEVGLEQPTWLPVIKPYGIGGAINGNITTENGINWGPAKLEREENGWTFIPEHEPYGPYRYSIEAQKGKTHLQVWDRVIVYKDGSFDREWDHVGYNRWRLRLVEDGIIPAPRAKTLQKMMRRQSVRIGRNAKAVHIPEKKVAQEARYALLSKMENAATPQTVDQAATLATENERLRQRLAMLEARQVAEKPLQPAPLPDASLDEDDIEGDEE